MSCLDALPTKLLQGPLAAHVPVFTEQVTSPLLPHHSCGSEEGVDHALAQEAWCRQKQLPKLLACVKPVSCGQGGGEDCFQETQ